MKLKKEVKANVVLESPKGFEKYNFKNCVVSFEDVDDNNIKIEIQTPENVFIKVEFEKQKA